MGKLRKALAVVGLGAFFLAACGGGNSQVWVNVLSGDTRPCLGAAHLNIKVNLPQGTKEFNKFGKFFQDQPNYDCMIGELSFPDLPMANGLNIQIEVWDLSTDLQGQLSVGQTSPAIDVAAGMPVQALDIKLERKVGIALGTAIASRPTDFDQIQGIEYLMFSVDGTVDGQPFNRNGYVAFEKVDNPDPFPLILSNLPTPSTLTEFTVKLRAIAGGNTLREWSGSAWLDNISNVVANVLLNAI